jgi:hypothetical protein
VFRRALSRVERLVVNYVNKGYYRYRETCLTKAY